MFANPKESGRLFANPSGVVHGTLVVGALLAAESTRRESFPATVGAVAVALMLYWLTHAYSEITEQRLETGEPMTVATVRHTLIHELALVGGAAMPLLALLVSWAVGAPLSTGVTAAIWTSVGIIVGIEVLAGVQAELTGRQLAVQISAGILFGSLVIVLHIILH